MEMTDSSSSAATASELFAIRPIGYVQSAYTQPEDVLHTHEGWTADVSNIRLSKKYAKLVGGLKGYSHIIVLFWIHRAKQWRMPKHHHKPPHVKLFATRMPVRPNPIGMSVVELVDFSKETGEITVKGLDALDGTPVLDIKPYITNFDSYPDARVPDWVSEHLNSHFHSHSGHSHDEAITKKKKKGD